MQDSEHASIQENKALLFNFFVYLDNTLDQKLTSQLLHEVSNIKTDHMVLSNVLSY